MFGAIYLLDAIVRFIIVDTGHSQSAVDDMMGGKLKAHATIEVHRVLSPSEVGHLNSSIPHPKNDIAGKCKSYPLKNPMS